MAPVICHKGEVSVWGGLKVLWQIIMRAEVTCHCAGGWVPAQHTGAAWAEGACGDANCPYDRV